jgi:putative spermidine/putrescine transport system permease protein
MTIRANSLAPLLAAPGVAVFVAFWLLPMARLTVSAGSGPTGLAAYAAIVTNPIYFASLLSTIGLSAAVTVVTLAICTVCGLFLSRHRFPGRSLLISLLTFPLALPGVVIGFLVILLGGRQGLIGLAVESLGFGRLVFAYSMAGLFVGYLYFSIPRVLLTVMAAAEKLDPALEEAARSLGASRRRVVIDVLLPGLKPALIASGAICFATSMGAFGTAFTLATRINVLPMTIYTEFTLFANLASAAALSIVLGAVTWAVLAAARSLAGSAVAAAA